MEKSISIYVAYHKPSALPGGSFHIPIHVGRALSDQRIEGTIGDDTGDNISSLNSMFCELTATYWAWKNDHTSDYIGICHYRRFFSYENCSVLSRTLNNLQFFKRKVLSPSRVHLCYHRIETTTAESLAGHIAKFENDIKKDLAEHSVDIFCLSPARSNLELESANVAKSKENREIIEKHFPQLYPYIDRLYHSKQFSFANMVIMKREIFDEYCTLLFGILDHHRQMGYSKQEELRLYGYIAENLTAAFVNYKQAASGSVVRSLSPLMYAGQ